VDVDPGTKISKIIYNTFKDKNTNPPPNFKNIEGLRLNQQTSSGKYHVETEGDTKSTNWRFVLKPGADKYTLENEKTKNIVRFNLDDENIEEFENYFLTKKMVEKTPEGMYKVISNKITYASNTYPKGTLLKLE
jgi:predicted DNA-binding protein